MIEREGQSLQPYGSLADEDETSNMRLHFQRGDGLAVGGARAAETRNMASAGVLLRDCGLVVRELFAETIADADRNRAKLEANKEERLCFWVDKVDERDVHAVASSAFEKLVSDATGFCLSKEWVSWQYIRLSSILYLEYDFLNKGSGGQEKLLNAEHDLHDIEHLVLLSRADGLLTRDKGLVIPLAKAAFPQKNVFSSLEEIPEEYLGDWSEC